VCVCVCVWWGEQDANRPTVRMLASNGEGSYSPEELTAMLLQVRAGNEW
jgi:hypothetical protein